MKTKPPTPYSPPRKQSPFEIGEARSSKRYRPNVGCIRNDGAATRADLADRLGLSIGTIRRRVRSMLEAGQLIEVGRAPLGGKLLGLTPGS